MLVVEGPNDRNTLRGLLPGVTIFPADGRRNALEQSRRLYEWSAEKWACVVDLDFDDEVAEYDLGKHLHPYHGADLEAMLITLGVLHDLLSHLGSDDKITREGGPDAVVNLLCGVVTGIASLRERNASEGWGLPFDEVPIEGKIDRRTLQLNVRGYCTALRPRSGSVELSLLIETMNGQPGGANKFSGKDVIAAAAVALRNRVGSLSKDQASVEVLLSALRASCTWRLSRSEWLSQLKSILEA